MTEYEQMLKNAYKDVKVVGKGNERFLLPKVEGQVSGNSTFITNIQQIASYLRRDVYHLSRFLQKELAVPYRMDGSRLVFKKKLSSTLVNEKIEKYAKEFVLCTVCGKPDTELISEKGIKFKHCLACGAKSPVKYHL